MYTLEIRGIAVLPRPIESIRPLRYIPSRRMEPNQCPAATNCDREARHRQLLSRRSEESLFLERISARFGREAPKHCEATSGGALWCDDPSGHPDIFKTEKAQ